MDDFVSRLSSLIPRLDNTLPVHRFGQGINDPSQKAFPRRYLKRLYIAVNSVTDPHLFNLPKKKSNNFSADKSHNNALNVFADTHKLSDQASRKPCDLGDTFLDFLNLSDFLDLNGLHHQLPCLMASFAFLNFAAKLPSITKLPICITTPVMSFLSAISSTQARPPAFSDKIFSSLSFWTGLKGWEVLTCTDSDFKSRP